MIDLLSIADVPETLRSEALANLSIAQERSRGMTLHKLKVRWLKAGKIARLLEWEDARLIEHYPDCASWDVAPMLNITAQGDNGVWVETPEGGRPIENYWLDPRPDSDEYRYAVSRNYWRPGEHPRSEKSRKAWYRRNGGEHEAWMRGWPVHSAATYQTWEGTRDRTWVRVHVCDGGWYVESRKTFGPLVIVGQYGFEVGNVFHERPTGRVQAWYPLPGYELRATVTWSTIPRLKGWND